MVKDMNRVYEWVYVSRMRTKEKDKKNNPMTDGTSFAPYPTRLGVFHLKIHKEGRKKARKGFKKKKGTHLWHGIQTHNLSTQWLYHLCN